MSVNLARLNLVGQTQRAAWAAAIRRPVSDHPLAMAAVSPPELRAKRAICANRRAAKTETTGRESLARMIELDGYVTWVFAGDLGEYSRNWLDRLPGGVLSMLQDLGVPHSPVRQAGSCIGITFPWGSSVRVFPSDLRGIQKARGGRLSLLIVDEAQKVETLRPLLLEVVGPAAADYGAEVWLSGTPGTDVDSLFARASGGAIDGWRSDTFYSWDNPHFGTTWRERYEAAVLAEILRWRHEAGVTPEQVAYLESIQDRAAAIAVPDHPIGGTLPSSVLREYFGRWCADTVSNVFALADVGDAGYWMSEVMGPAAWGDGDLQDLEAVPSTWAARVAALPKDRDHRGREHSKRWTALIGVDLGYHPDPFAMVAAVHAPTDPNLYVIGSSKATHLDEVTQGDLVELWVRRFTEIGIPVRAVVVDSSGGGGSAITAGWRARLGQRWRADVVSAEKHRDTVERQCFLLNGDIRRGTVKFVKDDPLSVELLHLQWRVTATGKREIHDGRRVTLANGRQTVSGDHCSDCLRYLWYWSDHVSSRPYSPTPDWSDPETVRRAARAREFAPAGNDSGGSGWYKVG